MFTGASVTEGWDNVVERQTRGRRTVEMELDLGRDLCDHRLTAWLSSRYSLLQ
jgi:hypothetical protein